MTDMSVFFKGCFKRPFLYHFYKYGSNARIIVMNIQDKLKSQINEALRALFLKADKVALEYPGELIHGDYSSNIALVLAKGLKKNPRELASQIVAEIQKNAIPEIAKVEVAGPGFINFYLSKQFFATMLAEINKEKKHYGWNQQFKGKKVLLEYTDPNPFKAFHIGHLMSNAIGESLSRLIEASGAEVKRANYQGDVGLHIAKAIYGIMLTKAEMPADENDNKAVVAFLGRAYALGSSLYDKDEENKAKIQAINKKVYARSDNEINELYDKGRRWSLEHFEELYKILGTHFDYYFFESQLANDAVKLVEENVEKGIFEKSDGAVVFHGENYGLHTRVFITKEGLPTYEAKELALNRKKFETVHPDFSIVITANEITEYFKVVMKAAEQIFPELAASTKHIGHGMLLLPTGKMSSRTGSVITGESLIMDTIGRVQEKMAETNEKREKGEHVVQEKTPQQVAVAAIKYSMLRQSPGKDIVYDMEKSLSLEGDSGPYLQYSTVRAKSVLEKAKSQNVKGAVTFLPSETAEIEKLLVRFPDIVERAAHEYSPSDIATYLITLASAFNSFYAKEQIAVDIPEAPYRIALTSAFVETMQNGLWLLGIETPESM